MKKKNLGDIGGISLNIYDFTIERQENIQRFLETQLKVSKKHIDSTVRDKDIYDIESFYTKAREGFWFCINSQNEIIGTLALKKKCIQNFEFGEIRRFYVDEAYQGQGVGTSLLKHVLRFAKANNYACIRGTTSKGSSAVIHIMKKAGCKLIPQYRESRSDIFIELWI